MTLISHILTGNEPLDKILSAAKKLYEPVAATAGPRGKNVIIRKSGYKAGITHDGVTVAKAINLTDPTEDAVIELMKEAAAGMEALTGDGTTTVTILTYAMLVWAATKIKAGQNEMVVKAELEMLAEKAVKEIEKHIIKRVGKKRLVEVATIASADPVIGKMVGEAIAKAGEDTPIYLDFSQSTKTHLELIDGVRIPVGMVSPYLFEDNEVSHTLVNPHVVLADEPLRDKEDILPILRAINQLAPDDRHVLIIAPDIAGDALKYVLANKQQKMANMSVVRVPADIKATGQYLADLGAVVGATVLSRNAHSIDDVTIEDFGRATKAVVDITSTIIVGGQAITEDIESHRGRLQEQLKASKTAAERNFIRDRLRMLSSQVLTVYVGGKSPSDAEERHYRFEDAIGAARSALRGGIVPGGGGMLYLIGQAIGLPALLWPFQAVLSNAGISDADIMEIGSNLEYGTGVDVTDPDWVVVYMLDAGIIDPAETEVEAVRTAANIAGLLISTGATIVEEEVYENQKAR